MKWSIKLLKILQAFTVLLMASALYLIWRHYRNGDGYLPISYNVLLLCTNALMFWIQKWIREANQTLLWLQAQGNQQPTDL